MYQMSNSKGVAAHIAWSRVRDPTGFIRRSSWDHWSQMVEVKWPDFRRRLQRSLLCSCRMFNQQELQILIGGIEEPVDVNDLMQNAVYGGVYDTDHVVIQRFWKASSHYLPDASLLSLTAIYMWLYQQVVHSLNQNERQQLLRFVTSCSRPPLLWALRVLYWIRSRWCI